MALDSAATLYQVIEHMEDGWLVILSNTESRIFFALGEESRFVWICRDIESGYVVTVANELTRGGRTREKKRG